LEDHQKFGDRPAIDSRRGTRRLTAEKKKNEGGESKPELAKRKSTWGHRPFNLVLNLDSHGDCRELKGRARYVQNLKGRMVNPRVATRGTKSVKLWEGGIHSKGKRVWPAGGLPLELNPVETKMLGSLSFSLTAEEGRKGGKQLFKKKSERKFQEKRRPYLWGCNAAAQNGTMCDG